MMILFSLLFLETRVSSSLDSPRQVEVVLLQSLFFTEDRTSFPICPVVVRHTLSFLTLSLGLSLGLAR